MFCFDTGNEQYRGCPFKGHCHLTRTFPTLSLKAFAGVRCGGACGGEVWRCSRCSSRMHLPGGAPAQKLKLLSLPVFRGQLLHSDGCSSPWSFSRFFLQGKPASTLKPPNWLFQKHVCLRPHELIGLLCPCALIAGCRRVPCTPSPPWPSVSAPSWWLHSPQPTFPCSPPSCPGAARF